MKTFEKLALSKFEDYKLDPAMSAKVTGGEETTGAGSQLVGSSSKIVGDNVVYTEIYDTWTSDSKSCNSYIRYGQDVSIKIWETPIA